MHNITNNIEQELFSWYDYTLFLVMLVLSTAIGVYYGFFGKKQLTRDEYLFGDKKMKVLPIALSLAASQINGTTLLAMPADIYRFGITFILYDVIIIATLLLIYYIYIPVFFNLRVTSIFEYLELRFNVTISKLSSFINCSFIIVSMPFIIFMSAFSLAQATGIDLHIVTIVLSAICIFYTSFGGLKSVVWTDSLQFIVMTISVVWIFIIGINHVGVNEVFKRSYDSGRLTIDFDPDPRKRDTLVSMLIGFIFTCTSYNTINQGFIQKCLSLPTISDVKNSLILYGFFEIAMASLTIISGLIMYAKYYDCDPLTAGIINKPEQIVPLYIMDISKNVPGLRGVFISGIVSAGLSTLSASLNAFSCVVYEDFIAPFVPKNISNRNISTILKVIVLISGTIITALVFVIEKVDGLMPIILTLTSLVLSPLLGLFSLGMLFPIANSKGAIVGALTSISITTTIVVKAYIYQLQGYLVFPQKGFSIEGCEGINNSTLAAVGTLSTETDFKPFYIFTISYHYYGLIAALLVIIVGVPVSYLTKSNKDKVIKKELISPVMHWWFKKDYHTIDKAIELVYPKVL